MNDDLERRLQEMGSRPVTSLDQHAVANMEARVMGSPRAARRVWVPITAAAAAVLLVAGVVLALRDDSRDSLEPSDLSTPTVPVTGAPVVTTDGAPSTSASPGTTTTPTSESAPTTTPGATVTTVVGTAGSVPSASTPPVTSVAPATSQPATATTTPASTSPPTIAPTLPPSTTEPSQPVPPASFRLTVRRVGDRLVFRWPVYAGTDGQRYLLVQVGPGGLTAWPPPPSRIATVVYRIDADTTSLTLPDPAPRRWVLAVLGADRRLLAVSDSVASS